MASRKRFEKYVTLNIKDKMHEDMKKHINRKEAETMSDFMRTSIQKEIEKRKQAE